MLGPIRGLGRPGYGLLYIVPGTYIYLIGVNSIPELPFVGTIPLWILICLFLLSFYGSVWLHRVGLLIFGDSAGMRSSVETVVSRQHIIYFASGTPASELPETKSMVRLISKAVNEESFQWIIFIRFLPAGLFYIYAVFAWVILTPILFSQNTGTIVALLWLALSILIFRNWITDYLPEYIPEESTKNISKPQYIAVREKIDEKKESNNAPRINTQQPSSQPRIRGPS